MENIDDAEITERYLILLLGVVDRPIPSPVHIQKELFLLSKANQKISEFITFIKHYKGPYSANLDDASKDPAYYNDAFQFDRNKKLYLTNEGKKIYEKFVKENISDNRFKDFLSLIRMTRDLYDKLTENELLFLVYATYNEYTEKSEISNRLLSSISRKKFTKSLLEKGLISEERAKELLSYND